MPRHMVAEAHELDTAPFSTSTSTRRWPSILLMGSIVIRFAILNPSLSSSGSVLHGCIAGQLDSGMYALFVLGELLPFLQGSRQNIQLFHRDPIAPASNSDQ